MAGGGKGGSQSTSVSIPAWLEEAAQRNLARADQLAQIGYTPYYGPDVAALTPMQVQAMQGTNQAAGAFGMGQVDPMAGMPQAQDFGGVMGYSSAPIYQGAIDALRTNAPGQFAALHAPFIDPVTGAAPAAPFGVYSGAAAPVGGGPVSAGSSEPGGGRENMTNSSYTPSIGGTGSFGLPDPMTGRVTGTNLPGPIGNVINSVIGGSGGSSGMGGGK
jgi:hypothetical protein